MAGQGGGEAVGRAGRSTRPDLPKHSDRSGRLVRSPRRARLLSWSVDYVVILTWLLVVLLVVGVPTLAGWVDLSAVWSRDWAADVAVTVLTVLPYLGYLVVTEAGPRGATWGKRLVGLAVVRRPEAEGPGGATSGGAGMPAAKRDYGSTPRAPGLPRVFVRNLVKVLPWQLGHMSAMRFATEADAVRPDAVWLYGASTVVLVAVALPPLLGRPGIHDVVAGTRVRPSRPV